MKETKFLLFAFALFLFGCQKDSLTVIETPQDSAIEFRATQKLLVCHNTGSETNPYELIELAEIAYAKAHQGHGDAQPGYAIPGMSGYKFGCNCEVEEVETIEMPDNKIWTAENLDVFPAGYELGTDFWWYENDEEISYGLLYTWKAANQACEDLGDGWRLPTKEDWDELISVYDDTWPSDGNAFSEPAYVSLQGNDSPSGFDARLGGGRFTFTNGTLFDYLGEYGNYWGSTKYSEKNYFSYYFDGIEFYEVSRGYNQETFGFSCRCVKNKD